MVEKWDSPEKAMQKLVATMSFECRTPLTSILGYSELLLSGKVGGLNEEQAEFLNYIRGAALNLWDYTDQLIAIQRTIIGLSGLEFQHVNIETILEEVSPNYISLEISPQLSEIEANHSHLERVFRMLISALDPVYGRDSKEVKIRVEIKEPYLLITLASETIVDDYPTMFYCNTVIVGHQGNLDISKSDHQVKITVSLPISQNS